MPPPLVLLERLFPAGAYMQEPCPCSVSSHPSLSHKKLYPWLCNASPTWPFSREFSQPEDTFMSLIRAQSLSIPPSLSRCSFTRGFPMPLPLNPSLETFPAGGYMHPPCPSPASIRSRPVHPSICSSIYFLIHPFLRRFFSSFLHLFVHLSVHLSIQPSVHPFIHTTVHSAHQQFFFR